MYAFGKYPSDTRLLHDILDTAAAMEEAAVHVEPNDLDISAYNRRYLREHLERMNSVLKKIGYLIASVVRTSRTPYRDLVLVEYGGGTGLPCAFAKRMGIGIVVYADHFPPSCADARIIHRAFGVEADAYVCGELETVVAFLASEKLRCDAFLSNDCIEHIYDIASFLRGHSAIPGERLAVAHASGANSRNPLLRRRLMANQRRRELTGFALTPGSKPTELPRPYLEVRKEIILNYAPFLPERVVAELAMRTRGKRIADIQAAVDAYRSSGKFPEPPRHPTNTCDPLNGNWAEHLLSSKWLAAMLSEAGFKTRVLPRFYGGTSCARQAAAPLPNALIHALGDFGLVLSPFFILYGERTGHE